MIEDRVSGDFFAIPDGAEPGKASAGASQSLFERLREFALDPESRRSWAQKARRIAISRFSSGRMVDQTIEVYRAALARRAAALERR